MTDQGGWRLTACFPSYSMTVERIDGAVAALQVASDTRLTKMPDKRPLRIFVEEVTSLPAPDHIFYRIALTLCRSSQSNSNMLHYPSN